MNNASKFTPLHDNVLLRPNKRETKTPGGIFIPDNVQKMSVEGDVVAVGRGYRTTSGTFVETQVKPGQRVLLASQYAATPVMIDGVEHVVMREQHIIGIVESST